MNQKNQPAFTINAETRRRIANEIKEHPQGKKVLKILENAHEGLTPKQQETIMSFLSKYAIDATSVLLGGGKIRGDIAKTVIDLIGSQIFTPMITNYRSEFKVRANAEMITGQVKIYNTILGSPIKGIFKNVPHGHYIRNIKLFDTREDVHKDKNLLTSVCGLDQQKIDIFGPKTFMTYEDWHVLTRAEEVIKDVKVKDKIRQNKSKRTLSNTIKESATKGKTKLIEKIAQDHLNIDERPTKVHSLIRKIKTKLIINNDMQCYYTRVKVYLCCCKRKINCDNKASSYTNKELFDLILNQRNQPYATNFLTQDELVKANSNEDGFFYSIFTKKNVNIFSKGALKENVNILRSYNFNLFPTETAIIEVDHHYEYGIDLYDLMRTTINEACAHTFFIVCSKGVDGARLTHIDSDAIRLHGTSPVRNRYEMSHTIQFTEKEFEEDHPCVVKITNNNSNFWEDDMSEFYHAERSSRKTVDFNDIIIGNKGTKDAKYVLDFNDKFLINDTLIRNLDLLKDYNDIEPENLEKIVKNQTSDETEALEKKNKQKRTFLDDITLSNDEDTFLEDIEDLDNE